MVTSELVAGGGTWTASSSVRQSLLPLEDVPRDNEGWARSRAQQQLLWDTLQSVKDKAAHAFAQLDPGEPLDPFRETYSDGGLFGAGCNYAVGFHGIQGRQPKSEDYVLHLALGPDLFAPFDDCSRACLACVLDGHGGTGAVQYVAERFPTYLLADLPRLRAQPAAAMRSALHRIDEELTALGHNSGTTVNALLLVDNRVTVVNTGDCRCILYDWVDERAVQVTHDHNLQSTRERERVLGEGAELSGCGSYVVLPCTTDGAKLLGVTKALGHAGVKALQRSSTLSSLSGILEGSATVVSPRSGSEADRLALATAVVAGAPPSSLSSSFCSFAAAPWASREASRRGFDSEAPLAAPVGGGLPLAVAAKLQPSQEQLPIPAAPSVTIAAAADGSNGTVIRAVASGSGMSDDDPVMPAPAVPSVLDAEEEEEGAAATAADAGFATDVDMGGTACAALTGHCLQHLDASSGDEAGVASRSRAHVGLRTPLCAATATAVEAPVAAGVAPPPPQRCNIICTDSNHYRHSSFASAAGAVVAAAVAASSPEPLMSAAVGRAGSAGLVATLSATGTGGSFMLTCEPDEFEFTVEDDRHLLLLGCDGVFDRMGNAEACKTALRHLTSCCNSCIDAAREVTHRACRLGSLDNITALVLRLGRKPIVRRQSMSVLSLRRINSNMSGDLVAAAAAGLGPGGSSLRN